MTKNTVFTKDISLTMTLAANNLVALETESDPPWSSAADAGAAVEVDVEDVDAVVWLWAIPVLTSPYGQSAYATWLMSVPSAYHVAAPLSCAHIPPPTLALSFADLLLLASAAPNCPLILWHAQKLRTASHALLSFFRKQSNHSSAAPTHHASANPPCATPVFSA